MTATTAVGDRVGIVELVTVCESMSRRHLRAFEVLGAWLRTEGAAGATNGRVLVEACHRHAELADLWAARQPAIPVEPDVEVLPRPDGDVLAWYRGELAALHEATVALRRRIDADLDPSTRRVIERVAADLAATAGRLD